MRVDVWNGDQSKHRGEGEYNEDVPVYFMLMPDGSLRSMANAEEKPDEALVPEGAQVLEMPANPKIVLDSGEVVYGCQVWWRAVLEPELQGKMNKVVDEVIEKLQGFKQPLSSEQKEEIDTIFKTATSQFENERHKTLLVQLVIEGLENKE